jgi:putative ABC transport system permease protein
MLRWLRLSVRFLQREWRTGELNILVIALLIAVGSTSTTTLFNDRLNRTMSMQAAAFLAADLVVTSHSALSDDWIRKAGLSELKWARSTEFSTVILNQDDYLLCGVKAVSSAYPLRGKVKTADDFGAVETVASEIPSPGAAWVEGRVLSGLGLSVGDSVEVGEKIFRVERVLTYEPDRRGNLLGLTPRVLINDADLAATGVIQPGSHAHYYFLFAGAMKDVMRFKSWLKPRLNPGEKLLDIREDRPEIGSAFKRAEKYLGLASVVVVMIAGVAIGMSASRYSRRHFGMTAILRCMGVRQNEVLSLFFWQLGILGIMASLVGCLLGWVTQELLVWYLGSLLPENLAQPGWYAFGFSILTGMVVLVGFTIPPLIQQRRVSPLRVLRHDLDPQPVNRALTHVLGLGTILILMWLYTGDLKLVSYFLVAASVVIVSLGGLVYVLIRSTRLLLPFLGLTTRFGIQQLSRNAISSVSQVVAFAVALTALIVLGVVRTDLISDWQEALPTDAPNHFALNIFPSEWEGVQQWFKARNVEVSSFYPVVRGRLTKINGQDAALLVASDSQAELALNRDLNLTYTGVLPEDNRIKAGGWWDGTAGNQLSIEQGLAESLGVGLGDRLTFAIGSRRLTVPVTSVRSVKWDTMKPNFYVIFSPGALDGYPSFYITSFYLPPERKPLLKGLVKAYPGVSFLEIDMIIRQVQGLVSQVTVAVEYVLVFALLAGVAVLFSAVYAGIDERVYSSCILRTLGAGRNVIRQNQCVEFASIGFMAGLLGAVSAESVLFLLYEQILDLPYRFSWQILVFSPVLGAGLIALLGLWCTRRTVTESPLVLIRENE